MNTAQWLRELGATRPMAPASYEVLALGTWSEGFYPIEWTRYSDTWSRDLNGNQMHKEPIEQWRIFGFLTHEPLTKEGCERILRSCKEENDTLLKRVDYLEKKVKRLTKKNSELAIQNRNKVDRPYSRDSELDDWKH